MKVGDLVKYRGWSKSAYSEPLGIIVDESCSGSNYHRRIRVMWVGEKVPVQAEVLSTGGKRITTWVNPKHFEIINGS